MKITVSDKQMSDFFNNWSNEIDEILLLEKKGSIIKNNTLYFLSPNIEKDYDTMLKNLQLIFGENKDVAQQVAIFDETLEFLNQVVQVEGAERLFSKHFYGMEWDMLLEADFEKSKMNVYRDHFLHQIRNAYFGFLLIWKFKIYKNIIGSIKLYEDSGFSQYINMFAKKEKCLDKDIFFAEVIKKGWFIAALFHDIGYPISYYYRVSGRMDKYMPYLRILDKRSQMDFIDLSSLLCDSYLFKMVEYDELKQSYEDLDHGMLSAICLLLNYYHGGLVNQLSNQDRCSIELAAHAIFLHTRKYSIQGKNSKWVKPCFVEDPIAYLLRICDDLQEWSRVYFIIGRNSNLLICEKCYGLVKKLKFNSNEYICNCKDQQKQFHKITSIDYRKINLVGACEELVINDDGKKIIFKLEYNLIKLLEVYELDKQYAKYRYKELENLRKLFNDQLLLPKMELEYFVSNNPQKIKAEIIRRIIKKNNSDFTEYSFDTYKEYKSKVEEEIMKIYDQKIDREEKRLVFNDCVKIELDKIEIYLASLCKNKILYEDQSDLVIESDDVNDISMNNALTNIYVYKIVYDTLK